MFLKKLLEKFRFTVNKNGSSSKGFIIFKLNHQLAKVILNRSVFAFEHTKYRYIYLTKKLV